MGAYVNPGKSGFEEMRKSTYVDKTGLIALINRTIETKQKLTCISRPRRFGKSFAAQLKSLRGLIRSWRREIPLTKP